MAKSKRRHIADQARICSPDRMIRIQQALFNFSLEMCVGKYVLFIQ